MSIDKLVAAYALAPEAYADALGTAKSIYLNHVFKDSKTGQGYNALLQDYSTRAKADIDALNKGFNDKWQGREIEEGTAEADAYDRELKLLNQKTDNINTELSESQNRVMRTADEEFSKIVSRVKKSLGLGYP
jgi:hypothetical protein